MPTPEEVRKAARNEAESRAALFAQAPPGRAGVLAAGQAGGLFGQAIGQAVGGRLPGEEKAMKFQQVQQRVTQELGDIDVSQPEGFYKMANLTARYANEAGLPEIAQQAQVQALEVRRQFKKEEKKENIWANIDPSKYTPESLKTFEATGSRSDLRVREEKDRVKNLSTGEKQVDKEFAKEYAKWTLGGGFADVEKNVAQLKAVKTRLESGSENLTGPIIGQVYDPLRAITNPESIEVRDEVEEVVQRNLRLILGAQFTQKEGERLIARAYNEKLDESVNAKRLGRLITAIEKAALAKQDSANYFEEKGTMKGFKGEKFSISEIERIIEEEEKAESGISDEEYEARKKKLGL